jgi:hypothetical protein
VDDAFGVTTLNDASGVFYQYIYFPSFFNNPADGFAPVRVLGNGLVINDYFTAPASPPSFSGGKVFFSELGTVGTIPPGGPVDKSDDQLYDPSGYYLVQTGATTYDMVAASNARAWISWFSPF